jgi:hypothetical protein
VTVLVGVVLAGLFGVMNCVHVVAVRHLCVVAGLFVIARFVVFGSCNVVFGRVIMVLGGFAMMFSAFS